jgi:hypothetical protein
VSRARLGVIVTMLGASMTGCATEAPAPEPVASASPGPTTSPAIDALDRLDGRRPVPLLPMMANHQKANMRDHLVAVQEIVAGAATEDYAAIERAAGRIGFSESMGQMCSHMGSGAPGFAEQAVGFHRAADRIATAARGRDRAAVLTELGATLQRCTSCHQVWKQQVVDEDTWERLTAAPAPHGEAGEIAP